MKTMPQLLVRLEKLERQRQKDQAAPPPRIVEVHLCSRGQPSGLAEVYDYKMNLLGHLVDHQPADEAVFAAAVDAELIARAFPL